VPEELGKSSYIRIVSLWIHPGQEAAFEACERESARIMARHGGRIDRAIGTSGQGVDAPFEVHIVSFPSRAAADSHAGDPDTTALRQRRAGLIARTLLSRKSQKSRCIAAPMQILAACGSSPQTSA